MSTFKERFNLLYEKSGQSQEEFGKIFSITKDQVFNWRNGRGEPDIDTMRLIAKQCDVSIDWLIGNSDNQYVNENKNDNSKLALLFRTAGNDLDEKDINEIADVLKVLIEQRKLKKEK